MSIPDVDVLSSGPDISILLLIHPLSYVSKQQLLQPDCERPNLTSQKTSTAVSMTAFAIPLGRSTWETPPHWNKTGFIASSERRDSMARWTDVGKHLHSSAGRQSVVRDCEERFANERSPCLET